MTNLDSWVTLNKEKIVALRRWLHQNPEIGFDEFNTAKHLSKILSEAGYEIITNNNISTYSKIVFMYLLYYFRKFDISCS